MKTSFLPFLMFLSLCPPALACSPQDARDFLETEILAATDPGLGCRVAEVSEEKKVWLFGTRYYLVTVRCEASPASSRRFKVVIDERSGECALPR